jgi:conjugal transfer/type IV secretion protein DotA/TraY
MFQKYLFGLLFFFGTSFSAYALELENVQIEDPLLAVITTATANSPSSGETPIVKLIPSSMSNNRLGSKLDGLSQQTSITDYVFSTDSSFSQNRSTFGLESNDEPVSVSQALTFFDPLPTNLQGYDQLPFDQAIKGITSNSGNDEIIFAGTNTSTGYVALVEQGDRTFSMSLDKPEAIAINALIGLNSLPDLESEALYSTATRSDMLDARILLESSLIKNGSNERNIDLVLAQFDTTVGVYSNNNTYGAVENNFQISKKISDGKSLVFNVDSFKERGYGPPEEESLLFFRPPIASPESIRQLGNESEIINSYALKDFALESLTDKEKTYLSSMASNDIDSAQTSKDLIIKEKYDQYKKSGMSDKEAMLGAFNYVAVALDSIALNAGIDPSSIYDTNKKAAKDNESLLPNNVTSVLNKWSEIAASPSNLGGLNSSSSDKTPIYNMNPTDRALELADEYVNIQSPIEVTDENLQFLQGSVDSFIEDYSTDQGNTSLQGNTRGLEAQRNFVDNFRLQKTDLIYMSLKRWFGGPVEAVYDWTFDSDGKMKTTTEGIKKSAPPTASFYNLVYIGYMVLIFSIFVAIALGFYGAYLGATEGSLFGEKRDVGAVSFKIAIAFVGNIPIPSLYGLSVIQAVVMVCIFISLAVAGSISYLGVSNLISTPVVEPQLKYNQDFAASILRSYTCLGLLEKEGELSVNEKLLSQPFQVLMSGKGVLDKGIEDVIANDTFWLTSYFFSGSEDPLLSSDKKSQAEGVASLYEASAADPYSDVITRFNFGAGGRCGSFTAITGTEILEEIDADVFGYWDDSFFSSENKKQGVGTNTTENPINIDDLANGDIDLSDALSDVTSTSHSEWKKVIETSKSGGVLKGLTPLLKELSDIAVELVENEDNKKELSDALQKGVIAEDIFYSTLRNELLKVLKDTKDPSNELVAKTVQRLGVGSLGSFFWFIESRQKQLFSFFDFTINSSKPNTVTGSGKSGNSEKLVAYDALDEAALKERFDYLAKKISARMGSSTMERSLNLLLSASENNSTTPSNALSGNYASLWIAHQMVNNLGDADELNTSPVERIRSFGISVQNTLIATTVVVIAAEAKMAGLKSLAGDSPLGFWTAVGQTVAKRFVDLVLSVSGPIATAAFVCANVIPNLPYAMFTIALIGLLIYYLEILLAANIWWQQKMTLDGHQLAGNSMAGYVILITMMSRAPLLAIGFFCGIGLNWVAGSLVNGTLMPAIQQSGGGGIFAFIGFIILYSVMQLIVTYKSFSLTWELPNRLTRYYGHNDHSDMGEQETKQMFLASAPGAASGMGASAMLKPNMPAPDKDKGGSDEKNDNGATPTASAGENAKAASDNQTPPAKTGLDSEGDTQAGGQGVDKPDPKGTG